MILFISSPRIIRDHCLLPLFDELQIVLNKHSVDEVILLDQTPSKIKEFIFGLCDGLTFDYFVNIKMMNDFLKNHVQQMRLADIVFIIEDPGILNSLRRKFWCCKFKKPCKVFSVRNCSVCNRFERENISRVRHARFECEEESETESVQSD
jgi:hypothetical protein